jgi:hypothetical protein
MPEMSFGLMLWWVGSAFRIEELGKGVQRSRTRVNDYRRLRSEQRDRRGHDCTKILSQTLNESILSEVFQSEDLKMRSDELNEIALCDKSTKNRLRRKLRLGEQRHAMHTG